jgi:hypothetical protein
MQISRRKMTDVMKQARILALVAGALLASPVPAHATGGAGGGPEIRPCPEAQNCGYDPTYDPIQSTPRGD